MQVEIRLLNGNNKNTYIKKMVDADFKNIKVNKGRLTAEIKKFSIDISNNKIEDEYVVTNVALKVYNRYYREFEVRNMQINNVNSLMLDGLYIYKLKINKTERQELLKELI